MTTIGQGAPAEELVLGRWTWGGVRISVGLTAYLRVGLWAGSGVAFGRNASQMATQALATLASGAWAGSATFRATNWP